MFEFDPSQQLVLGLDPTLHARVVGAPGSGKTATLVEACARLMEGRGWSESDLLVLAPNRAVASQLGRQLERRLHRAIGGTPVRTAASLAFSVLQRTAASAGRTPPRLLTGTAHDEAIAEVVRELAPTAGGLKEHFAPEVLQGEAFRAELRELARVLDDFGLRAEQLAAEFAAGGGAGTDAGAARVPRVSDPDLIAQWIPALEILAQVDTRLASTRPDELSSSRLLREAVVAIGAGGTGGAGAGVPIPRLVMVDDAQELGEGELALLGALAGRGTRLWAFGDPDIATGAFHGERTRILAGVSAELQRIGVRSARGTGADQVVVLGQVHRHGAELRSFVQQLSRRVGTAGAGQQRAGLSAIPSIPAESAGAGESAGLAESAEPAEPEGATTAAGSDQVQFATVATLAEQLGVIAHRLRRRRLGVGGGDPVRWSDMAVICRSRSEVTRAARVLAGHQVPTSVGAGGVVLREHQLVRELVRLLQHAIGIRKLDPHEILEMLGGAVGGLDPIAMRRLRGELRLQENREARAEAREAAAIDTIVAEAFAHPAHSPRVDSRAGRRLQRLGRLAAAGVAKHEHDGTPREVLWEIWQGTGLAEELQALALDGRGARSEEAHRTLDAVLGLFFVLQRHEEQDSDTPIAALLEELLASAVPEDSLAARSERDVVTVTTPQGVIGCEYAVVCVIGPQDGSWPNLRARGSLLGVTALERWIRGDDASAPSRRDTLHDELRLFVHACARARSELLAVAVADEDHHPSPFFGLGRVHQVAHPLPSTRLTLRGAVAEMRRRATLDPEDPVALASLVALAQEGVAGAHPSEWYGILPASTQAPLIDLAGDPDAQVPVSPSRLEDVERCPLDWAISQLGGATTSASQGIGTLLHRALEMADGAVSPERIIDLVVAEWGVLEFEAGWQSSRQLALVHEMARGISDYLADFEQSDREVLGREAVLGLRIGRARISGKADRLEARRLDDGRTEVSVVDLKTGRKMPSAAELAHHAQLQAYQLGVVTGSFSGIEADECSAVERPAADDPGADRSADRPAADGSESRDSTIVNGGARLLYVHPDVRTTQGRDGGSTFRQPTQPLLDDDARREFETRVEEAAQVMAGGSFLARVEHHCSDPHSPGGSCRLHIIPAVSRA